MPVAPVGRPENATEATTGASSVGGGSAKAAEPTCAAPAMTQAQPIPHRARDGDCATPPAAAASAAAGRKATVTQILVLDQDEDHERRQRGPHEASGPRPPRDRHDPQSRSAVARRPHWGMIHCG